MSLFGRISQGDTRNLAKVLVTAPSSEPLTTTEAFLHIRQDFTDSATITEMQDLITVARQFIENNYSVQLMPQTWKVYYPGFPAENQIWLPFGPLATLSWVKYYDVYDSVTTLDSTLYSVNTSFKPPRVVLGYNKYWPLLQLRPDNPVEIQGVFGYADAASVPRSIKHAMKLLIGHWYDQRADVVNGSTAVIKSEYIKNGVDSLMAPYRIYA